MEEQMGKQYMTCAETAKLVRQALKEAFPGVKFGVRSKTYSGGASINIYWTDGPNTKQVESVTGKLEGSYFDGMIDYKGSISHMIDGQQVSLGADFIFCNRHYSDATIQKVMNYVCQKYRVTATVEQYKSGNLYNTAIAGAVGWDSRWNLQSEINVELGKRTYCLTRQSKTAGKVMITGDDGYSRMCGSGMGAVDPSIA
jgi:hypothetical protein